MGFCDGDPCKKTLLSMYEVVYGVSGSGREVLNAASYMTNRIGDHGEPCGRPDWNCTQVSCSPSKARLMVLLVLKAAMQQTTWFGK